MMRHLSRALPIAALLGVALFASMTVAGYTRGNVAQITLEPSSVGSANQQSERYLVEVTIGVMSRCPDALYFENAFSRVVERVNDKMRLSLVYIASRNRSAPYGATCKHGDGECQGNIHQLCVIDSLDPDQAGQRWDLSPSAAQRQWWDFVQCENYVGGAKRIGEESLAEQCTQAVGNVPDWEKDGLSQCAKGKKGRRLLQGSIEMTKLLKIRNSATLQIEGETVCVRDDNQWKDCPGGHEAVDWVRQIEDIYNRKNGINSKEAKMRPLSIASSIPFPLLKRQDPGNNGTQSQPGFPNNGTNGGQNNQNQNQGAPLSVFTFIIAIALFVLVVSFVLLRIFVRNRRLRRMGIYPEGPIDRFLGGNIREYEDTLPPPRLWEAKIADIRAGTSDAKSEKTGAAGFGDSKQCGWDALMPISAALPPNLYSVLFDSNAQGTGATNESPVTYPPSTANQHTTLLGRRMPHFLRRHTGEGAEGGNTAGNGVAGAVAPGTAPASALTTAASPSGDPPSAAVSATGDRVEEKMAASVNITVLIAMPSPRTVFPAGRRDDTVKSLNARPGLALGGVKLDEASEDASGDQENSSLKGKARRAPSLRSVKSTTSVKSIADVRREAFFTQMQSSQDDNAQTPLPSSQAPAYVEEDEELPELMFGTASVPVFTRLAISTGAVQNLSVRSTKEATGSLTQPSRSDILSLVLAAKQARERKAEADLAAAASRKKHNDDGEAEASRRSGEDLSLDADGSGANVASAHHERSGDDSLQSPIGDVTTRMFRTHELEGQSYEMGEMGPSRDTYPHQSFETSRYSDVQTPNTLAPLTFGAGPMGAVETPTAERFSRSELSMQEPATPLSTQTAQEGAMTPTTSMPFMVSDAGHESIASFRTGRE